MPNVAQVLKEEIARVSRKGIRAAIGRIAKPTATARHTQAELKRRITALEKQAKQLLAMASKLDAAQPASSPEQTAKIRVTGKGMRSLRRKLRLSQAEFGRLLGVTEQAVYMWEHRNGALRVRDTTRANLMAVRGIGAREARARLAAKKTARSDGNDGEFPHGHRRAKRKAAQRPGLTKRENGGVFPHGNSKRRTGSSSAVTSATRSAISGRAAKTK